VSAAADLERVVSTPELAAGAPATATARYRSETGREPKTWLVQAVEGAGCIDP
jgi:hypothetical protein